MESSLHKRSASAIAGEVYRSVERHVEGLLPIWPRAPTVGEKMSEPSSTGEVEARTLYRPKGGAGKRSSEVEARTLYRPKGGAGKRSAEVEARTLYRPKGGADRRSADVDDKSVER